MAKTTRMTIRLSEDERRQIHEVVRQLGLSPHMLRVLSERSSPHRDLQLDSIVRGIH